MTAKYLFEQGLLDARFDKVALLSTVLMFFDEVIAAVAIFEELIEEHNSAVAAHEKQKSTRMTLLLPSMRDITGRAKSFIQRTEHSVQRLLALCQSLSFASWNGVVRQLCRHGGVHSYTRLKPTRDETTL